MRLLHSNTFRIMMKGVAVAFALIHFFSADDAFQGLTRLSVEKQIERHMIDKLQVEQPAETPKKTSRLGGLLLSRKRKVATVSKDLVDEEKVVVTQDKKVIKKQVEVQKDMVEMPIITHKKPLLVATKAAVTVVKQWESRKDVVVMKTAAVEVKKVVDVPVSTKKVDLAAPVINSKNPIKSVKQVVAAYDIDDDDFMSQFMDEGAITKKGDAASQRSVTKASSSSIPRTGASDISAADPMNTSDAKSIWPGPGVPWMSGPVDNNSKKDQNRGRNALMATADDDLQRMVDQRNEARYRRDYDGADAIREELRTIFRVEIYDKLGEWVAADGRWGLSNRKRGAGSEDGVPMMAKIQIDAKPCSLTYDQVMDMVVKRTNARRTRQFQVADDIRDELARVGVELFDKVNEWRTFDGQMRGIQSEDFEKYEVKKDFERYDRGNSRDSAW